MTDNVQFLFSSLQRLQAFPLEKNSKFETISELENYLINDKTAYRGQIISVDEVENAFIVIETGENRKYKRIGISDEEVFVIAENVSKDHCTKLYEILNPKIEVNSENIAKNLEKIEENSDRIDTFEAKVKAIQDELSGIIKNTKEKFEAIDKKFIDISNTFDDIKKSIKEKDDAIEDIKSDIAENYAKRDWVSEEIKKQRHFITKVVESLDEVTEKGVLYLYKAHPDDKSYQQYMIDDETGERIMLGTTEIDLTGYATKQELDETTAKISKIIESAPDEFDTLKEVADKLTELQGSVNENKVTEIFMNLMRQMFVEINETDVTTTVEENVEKTELQLGTFTQIGESDINSIIGDETDDGIINTMNQLTEEEIMRIIAGDAQI